jgi:hypothetical protein
MLIDMVSRDGNPVLYNDGPMNSTAVSRGQAALFSGFRVD